MKHLRRQQRALEVDFLDRRETGAGGSRQLLTVPQFRGRYQLDLQVRMLLPDSLDRRGQITILSDDESLVVTGSRRLVQQPDRKVDVRFLFLVACPAMSALWASAILVLEMAHDRGDAVDGQGTDVRTVARVRTRQPCGIR